RVKVQLPQRQQPQPAWSVPPPVHGANNVLDCCLRTKDTPIPWRIVQDYRLQLVQDGCNIPAAVFITTKGKRLCAPPQALWVIRLQEKLNASSARKVRTRPA
ncbi:CCL19 protein, partial [Alopecoenas beccarii]|nr:CCL19 protein [Alopecoenas beccarii]